MVEEADLFGAATDEDSEEDLAALRGRRLVAVAGGGWVVEGVEEAADGADWDSADESDDVEDLSSQREGGETVEGEDVFGAVTDEDSADDDQGLSAYERFRLRTIRRNQDYLTCGFLPRLTPRASACKLSVSSILALQRSVWTRPPRPPQSSGGHPGVVRGATRRSHMDMCIVHDADDHHRRLRQWTRRPRPARCERSSGWPWSTDRVISYKRETQLTSEPRASSDRSSSETSSTPSSLIWPLPIRCSATA